MPSNTGYNPLHIDDFEKDKLNYNGQGISVTITAGQTQNLDYTLTDDCLITGAWIISNAGNYGDYVHFQVVDPSGTFTGTPGTVLNQFATMLYFPAQADTQIDIVYPAKILAGMTLRVVYTSTGDTNVFLAVNYKLHKVLV
jgi:hypothetical protein